MNMSTTVTTDIFDLMRLHNLYLVPCGPDGWYCGNWDEDWKAGDHDCMGRMGITGDTPEEAVRLAIQVRSQL